MAIVSAYHVVMRPHGSPAELEKRRWRAIKLLKGGMSIIAVARRLGCSHSSVILWRDAVRRNGELALKAKPAPGRPRKLGPAQLRRLPALLLRGALAWGYSTELWTTGRVAEVVEREFGVRFHRAHVGRLLADLGWSCQKPERRAIERDSEAIERWKRYRWTAIKKKVRQLKAHLAFLDESGFLLIPNVRRTWAPRGQTPIVWHRYRHDRISAISVVTVSFRRQRLGLYFHLHRENISQIEVALFLRYLLRQIRGPIVLLWDGGGIHTGEQIQTFLDRHPRLHVERFPAYAPELNPDEWVWRHCKAALANGRPDNLDELLATLQHVTRKARRRPSLLRSFVTGSDLPPFLRS